MPRTKISEYSATANSNTDIGGINVDEGCAPSGINDAIRTMMAQLKNFQTGTGSDSFNGPVNGAVNGTVGATTPATGAFTTLTTSSTVTHNGGTANGVAYLNGSKVLTTGSALVFDGTNLGVGTASPGAKIHLKQTGANVSGLYVEGSANDSQVRVFNNGTVSGISSTYGSTGSYMPLTFLTSDTERARIDSSGNLLVGTTSPVSAGKIYSYFNGATTNGIEIQDSGTNSGATFLSIRNSGGTQIGSITRVTTTNAVVYNTTSDYRLKTVIGAVTGHGTRIDALKPVDYQWKEDGQTARGFLAHEFQEVYGNSVSGTKDAVDADGNPKYQAMQASTPEVIADLVAEIQSLRQRLAAAGI